MKIIILVFFLLLPYISWSAARDPIQISITNNLSTACHLKDNIIIYGHISDHSKIPKIIHPNQSSSFKMRAGPNYHLGIYIDKAILLTYECESGQEITLYTSANNNQIDQKRFEVKGMWANSAKQSLGFSTANIYWELTY